MLNVDYSRFLLSQRMHDLHQRKASAKTQHDRTTLQRQIDATDNQIDAPVVARQPRASYTTSTNSPKKKSKSSNKPPNRETSKRPPRGYPRSQIFDYLLSRTHEDGKHKAEFFKRFGFRATEPYWLADTLRAHICDNNVIEIQHDRFGPRYVVEGIMEMPDGRTANVRSIWMMDERQEIPRLVTAFPAAKVAE